MSRSLWFRDDQELQGSVNFATIAIYNSMQVASSALQLIVFLAVRR